jgi:hypothetical protein
MSCKQKLTYYRKDDDDEERVRSTSPLRTTRILPVKRRLKILNLVNHIVILLHLMARKSQLLSPHKFVTSRFRVAFSRFLPPGFAKICKISIKKESYPSLH